MVGFGRRLTQPKVHDVPNQEEGERRFDVITSVTEAQK